MHGTYQQHKVMKDSTDGAIPTSMFSLKQPDSQPSSPRLIPLTLLFVQQMLCELTRRELLRCFLGIHPQFVSAEVTIIQALDVFLWGLLHCDEVKHNSSHHKHKTTHNDVKVWDLVCASFAIILMRVLSKVFFLEPALPEPFRHRGIPGMMVIIAVGRGAVIWRNTASV